MILFLMFIAIALSIVKANGWIIVPTSCVVLCWIIIVWSWLIYSYARGIGEEISKQIKEQEAKIQEHIKGEDVDLLAEYENTGLTPEEIIEMKGKLEGLRK